MDRLMNAMLDALISLGKDRGVTLGFDEHDAEIRFMQSEVPERGSMWQDQDGKFCIVTGMIDDSVRFYMVSSGEHQTPISEWEGYTRIDP